MQFKSCVRIFISFFVQFFIVFFFFQWWRFSRVEKNESSANRKLRFMLIMLSERLRPIRNDENAEIWWLLNWMKNWKRNECKEQTSNEMRRPTNFYAAFHDIFWCMCVLFWLIGSNRHTQTGFLLFFSRFVYLLYLHI